MKNNDSSGQSETEKSEKNLLLEQKNVEKLDVLVAKFPKVAKNLDKRRDNPAIKELSKALKDSKTKYDKAATPEEKKRAIDSLTQEITKFTNNNGTGQSKLKKDLTNLNSYMSNLIENKTNSDTLITQATKVEKIKPKSTIPRAVINQAKAAMSSATTAVAKKMPFNKRRTEKKATSMTK